MLYAIGMIMVQALHGAGDTRTPSRLNLLCLRILQIPLAGLLALKVGLGPNGLFPAIVVPESLLTLLAIVFRRGRWQTQAA